MSNSIVLLGKALTLLKEESQHMALGDIDAAEEKYILRARLLDEAWENRQSAPADEYRRILQEISDSHEKLMEDTARFKEKLREKLSRSRQETRRLSGYRLAVEQAVRYQ